MKRFGAKKRLIWRLRSKGVHISKIEDLMEPGLDFEIIEKEISKFLSDNDFESEFTDYLSLVSRFILIEQKIGYEAAIKYIETQEDEDKVICSELKKVGVRVKSIYDLVNTSKPYPEAIPTLVEWLPKLTNESIKQGVVRALTLKGAGEGIKKGLIVEYERHRDTKNDLQASLRWAIGNALSVVLKKQDLETILKYVKDHRYGSSRITLIEKLAQWKIYDSIDILIDILNEEGEDLGSIGRSMNALGRLKAEKAKGDIEKFITHPHPSIQKAAKKALERINL